MSGVEDPEVEDLRAERDRLRAEVDRLQDRRERSQAFRVTAVGLLVVIAVVAFTGSIMGAWARRNVLDTERFVSRVAPLVEEPAVQEALSTRLTAELMLLVDPQGLFEEALPERGQILAVPLASAVEGFVGDRVERFVASDRFARLWESAVRTAHDASRAVLREREGEVLTIADGQVALDLVPVVNALLAEIGSTTPEVFGREIDLPELTVDDVPEEAIERLESVVGVELDADYAQIVVYDEDTLAIAQDSVRLVDRSVFVLVPVSALTAGVALWLSSRPRRTLLQLAGGTIVAMVILRRVAFSIEDSVAAVPPTEIGQEAASLAIAVFLDPVITFAAWSLAVAAVIVVAAVLTGDYPWVVSLRRRVRGLSESVVTAAGERSRDEATVAWVTEHRDGLLVGGVAAGLAVLWATDLSWFGLLLVLGLVVAFEALVYRMAGGELSPPGDASAG